MIFDSCPNCNGKLSFFNFNCGFGQDFEISQQYLCRNCDYCSFTFNNQKATLDKIKAALDKKTNFFVTCTDQVIENYDHKETVLLMDAQDYQEQFNKKYTLELNNIIGFDDIKRALLPVVNVHNKKHVHFLIAGYPGTAKTVFLESIKAELEPQGAKCDYIDCSNLTGAGILDYLLTTYVNEGRKIDFLLLDEIDKTDIDDQKKFLNVLQTGIAKNMKKNDKREARISLTAIATGNDINRIYHPLFDRFITVYIPKYTKDQFYSIGQAIITKKYHYSPNVAKTMIDEIYQIDGSMRRVDDLCILIKNEATDKDKLDRFNDILNTLVNRQVDPSLFK